MHQTSQNTVVCSRVLHEDGGMSVRRMDRLAGSSTTRLYARFVGQFSTAAVITKFIFEGRQESARTDNSHTARMVSVCQIMASHSNGGVPAHALKACGWREGVAPKILNLGSRRKTDVSLKLRMI